MIDGNYIQFVVIVFGVIFVVMAFAIFVIAESLHDIRDSLEKIAQYFEEETKKRS